MGCSFNCTYCYVNGSKYAENTNLFYIKSNATHLLKTQLKKKYINKERALINIGSASDAYQPIEKELCFTEDLLKIIYQYKNPIHIITKSDLVLRDIDILKKINNSAILPEDIKNIKSKVIVSFSFSTINNKASKLFEPKAPSIEKRLNALEQLNNENITTGVSFMPILPYIADSNDTINKTISTFKDYGANYVIPGSLTLFGKNSNSSRCKYFKVLNEYYPEYYEKTRNLFWNNKNKDYSDYPSLKYQQEIYKKVSDYCRKYNIKNSII